MYARDLFPWIAITPALTVNGFLDHRHTHHRTEWGQVLASDDAKLVDALLRRLPLASFGIADETMQRAYGQFLVDYGLFETVLTSPLAELRTSGRAFLAGWKSSQEAHLVGDNNG